MSHEYRNGHKRIPEVDRFMANLLGYDDSYYHAPDVERPRMVPMRKWVKPTGVTPIFPGGPGVQGSRFPHRGIMILMQDFDVESTYLRAVERGYTASEDKTTIGATELLREAGVDLNDCYFTNRFVGVRDAESQYGANPGWCSPKSPKQYKPYVTMSDEILKMQLFEQTPKLVLMYGTHVPRSLGFENLWSSKLLEGASILGHVATVAALVHPSFRPINIGKVKYGDRVGHGAEITLVRDAMRAAGLPLQPAGNPEP